MIERNYEKREKWGCRGINREGGKRKGKGEKKREKGEKENKSKREKEEDRVRERERDHKFRPVFNSRTKKI